MGVKGFQKLTLLDYPGKLAATVFFGGCNFRCPFCHNAGVVLEPGEADTSDAEIFEYLEKRRGVLDGVCITGGEPLLYAGIESFIDRIKALGLLIKLDTNGYSPDALASLLKSKKLDAVAMDIKNSPQKYAETAGVKSLDIEKIKKSISIIMKSGISYEFRTTLVRPFHTLEDMQGIGSLIPDARQYFLQNYSNTGEIIAEYSGKKSGFSSFSDEEMLCFLGEVRKYIPNASIRGK